ncbi:MAG: histidinol-phosphatase [Erysipelotrichaceae bacterium]|nr:histidinol-phosphatase [Erysipelotrichaceae bacterium]
MEQIGNYHTHTYRCGHAYGDDEQYIKAAIMAGFKELGFSEHIGYPCIDKPQERMLYKDQNEYLETMHKLQQKYADQIKLFIGFEIEYFDDQFDYLKTMRSHCDYMIVGQHCRYVEGCGYDQLSDDEAVIAYKNQLIACMKSGLVSMVAHPDYFMLGRRDFSETCEQAAHEICACAVACDIPLEINLNGLRYGKLRYIDRQQYAYPFRSFWEIAANYPIKAIYGFDAHQPTTLLEHGRIEEVQEILKDLQICLINQLVLK